MADKLKDIINDGESFKKICELLDRLKNSPKGEVKVKKFSINEQKLLKVLLENELIIFKKNRYKLNYNNPATTTFLSLISLLNGVGNKSSGKKRNVISQDDFTITYTEPHRHEFLRTDRPDPVADRKKHMKEMINKQSKE